LFACLFVCLFICLFVYLFIYLFIYLFVLFGYLLFNGPSDFSLGMLANEKVHS